MKIDTKKIHVVLKVNFYLRKEEITTSDNKRIIDAIKRNINGWQYSSADVGIEKIEESNDYIITPSGVVNEIELV